MSVDYNPINKFVAASKKLTGNSFTGRLKGGTESGAKNNNKYSGFTVKSGGHPTKATVQHGSERGLMVNKVNKPVKTSALNKKTVWKGGGQPSTKIVQAKGKSAVNPRAK